MNNRPFDNAEQPSWLEQIWIEVMEWDFAVAEHEVEQSDD